MPLAYLQISTYIPCPSVVNCKADCDIHSWCRFLFYYEIFIICNVMYSYYSVQWMIYTNDILVFYLLVDREFHISSDIISVRLKAGDILLMIVIKIQTEPIGKSSLLQEVTFQIFQDYTLLAIKDWSTLFLFALSVKGQGLHVNLVKRKALFKVSNTTRVLLFPNANKKVHFNAYI